MVESVPVEDHAKPPKSEREAVKDPSLAVIGLVGTFLPLLTYRQVIIIIRNVNEFRLLYLVIRVEPPYIYR